MFFKKLKKLLKLEFVYKNKFNFLASLLFLTIPINTFALYNSKLIFWIFQINKSNLNQIPLDTQENFILYFVGVLLIGPLLEELSFRLCLTKELSWRYIGLSILVLSSLPWQLAIFFVLIFTSLHYFKKSFYYLNYKSIVFFSFTFAFIHLGNFYEYFTNIDIQTIILRVALVPIILLPYFILGICLSLIRVKIGFRYSVLAHIFLNFLAFLPSYLIVLLGQSKNVTNGYLIEFFLTIFLPIIFIVSPLFCKYQNNKSISIVKFLEIN